MYIVVVNLLSSYPFNMHITVVPSPLLQNGFSFLKTEGCQFKEEGWA